MSQLNEDLVDALDAAEEVRDQMRTRARAAEQQLAAKDALLRQAQEALMAVSPLMIPGVTWSCNVGTMIKSMVRKAVDAIDKELGK
jgi:hypothetical protein